MHLNCDTRLINLNNIVDFLIPNKNSKVEFASGLTDSLFKQVQELHTCGNYTFPFFRVAKNSFA